MHTVTVHFNRNQPIPIGSCKLCVFDSGMVLGARQAGLNISETADPLEFSCTAVARVT